MDESKSRSQPQWKGQTNIQSQQAITLCQSSKKSEASFYNSPQFTTAEMHTFTSFTFYTLSSISGVGSDGVCMLVSALTMPAVKEPDFSWKMDEASLMWYNRKKHFGGHNWSSIDSTLSEAWSVLICTRVWTSVWHPSVSVCDTCVSLKPQTHIDSGKLPCESDNAIWGPARWLGLCWAAAGGEGGSYLRLMVVHALSLVRHSHGNTSTVHGANSSSLY